MTQVFFDECGNTGQNLLDDADPIFVLASCSFSVDEEKEVLSHFQKFNGPELKFSRLRRTSSGQKAVLAFLSSPTITAKAAAAVVFHKPFMVVSKYCDLVLEPSFCKAGLNFYKRGENIATANLLTTLMPVFLNPTTWASFLSLFVRVVRHREPKLFDDWRRLAELIFAHLDHAHPNIAAFFAPVFLLRDCNELFKTLNDDELDPLVPAYHVVVNHWGKSLGCFYQIIADESKVLARERSRLLALSDPNLEPVSVGYDRRKMDYPLKASNIVAIDSTAHRQVQLADILSGAIANAAKARTKGSLEAGTFALDVFNLCFAKELIIDGLWPNHEVDPKALGTDIEPGADDVDLSTYTAMILGGHPITKRRSK